jgi:hypothetical protein
VHYYPMCIYTGRLILTAPQRRADELWHLLLHAYERGAHDALGYDSWGEYFEAEFGQSGRRGYQLIDANRVVRAIESHSTNVERQ